MRETDPESDPGAAPKADRRRRRRYIEWHPLTQIAALALWAVVAPRGGLSGWERGLGIALGAMLVLSLIDAWTGGRVVDWIHGHDETPTRPDREPPVPAFLAELERRLAGGAAADDGAPLEDAPPPLAADAGQLAEAAPAVSPAAHAGEPAGRVPGALPAAALPSRSWLTLIERRSGPALVWATSPTREAAEARRAGDLGGQPTTWRVEPDAPSLDVWFRDHDAGAAWLVSRDIWFQRHARALAAIAPYLDRPAPAWVLLHAEGESDDAFACRVGGADRPFPWPDAERPRCGACDEPLRCLRVIDGRGSPGWFTDAPGALVILLCPTHWYERAEVRYVARALPHHVHGPRTIGGLLAAVATADVPSLERGTDPDEESVPGTERLAYERVDDFLVCYGDKLGGVPHWIQDPEPPRRRGLARADWRFVGQFTGTADIDLGDSGLLYVWRDERSGSFATRAQCY